MKGGTMGSTVRCGCGRQHGDGSRLQKVGWRPAGEGRAKLVAACPCGGAVTLAVVDDASFCRGCGRLLHLEVKLATPSGVLCVPCGRRSEFAILPPVIRRIRVGGAER